MAYPRTRTRFHHKGHYKGYHKGQYKGPIMPRVKTGSRLKHATEGLSSRWVSSLVAAIDTSVALQCSHNCNPYI